MISHNPSFLSKTFSFEFKFNKFIKTISGLDYLLDIFKSTQSSHKQKFGTDKYNLKCMIIQMLYFLYKYYD